MQLLKLRFAAVALTALLTVPLTAQTPATLKIQLDKSLHPVSPELYGLMTEEINYSYDGGVYAELIRNRTFQDYGFGGVAHWNIEHTGDATATMSVDQTQGPSEALPHSLMVNITTADAGNRAGVRNEGYWGIALRPNTTYKGSLYAKADSADFGSLTVALVNDNTAAIAAAASTQPITAEWKRYDFSLTTGKIAVSAENHFLVTASHTGKLWLDLVTLMPPTYKNRENGNRPDLVEMMAAMHQKFLRLPGGNYLEGDLIDERFDWKNTIGPLVDRPTHRSPWKLPILRWHGPARVS